MKKKYRVLVIDEQTFYWTLSFKYMPKDGQNKAHVLTYLRFWKDYNQFKCTIIFKTCDFYFTGNPLNTGVTVKQNDNEVILNLNLPGIVTQIIRHCTNKAEINPDTKEITFENGLNILEELGFETDRLRVI